MKSLRILDCNEYVVDSLIKSIKNVELTGEFEDTGEYINPLYNKITVQSTIKIDKKKEFKRKRDDDNTDNVKKYRVDSMIPIEDVVENICGKTDLNKLTVKQLKDIIKAKNLDIKTSKMLKAEIVTAVENELYENEYADEIDTEHEVIQVKSVSEQNISREQRRQQRNAKRDVIINNQEIVKKRTRMRQEVVNLSTLFSGTL
tara:strand:- start:270 stop:875 length:606 start_codon:yes stop_codon:yes gene_type:complete